MDIGIDFIQIQRSNEDTILDNLKLIFKQIYDLNLNLEIKINSVTYDMIHFSFPQYNKNNKQIDKNVQVDILLTKYPTFCKFYMYSPTELESKYKGAHRNELLRAICYTMTYKPLYKENNEVLKWKQDDLDSTGLYHHIKTLIDDNGDRLKYKDTNEDLIPSYAKVISSKLISHKPERVIQILLGNKYTKEDIDTFEKLFNIILNDQDFRFYTDSVEILTNCAKAIKENTKLIFPIELEKYLRN